MLINRKCQNNDFSLDDFLPYMPQFLSALFVLIDEAESIESKNRIIKCINCIISQGAKHVRMSQETG